MPLDKKQILLKLTKEGLTEITALKDFEKLQNLSSKEIMEKANSSSRIGNDFVNFYTFAERLNTKGRKGINFYDFYAMKNELSKKKYIKNLIDHYGNNGKFRNEPNLWHNIFRLYWGAISIFKPLIAMEIYTMYKPKSILDMTMGWGGRLVGACALNIPKYTGIDLNTNLKRPYEDMVKVLRQHSTTDIKLYFTDALKVDYSKIDYDLVLTSPPYYNIEMYKGQKKMDKEEWDKNFYEPLFVKTWEHLKKGGHYCLNIPAEVYDRVAVKVLGKANSFIPLFKQKRTKTEKYKEYIYVWNKK